MSAPAVDRDWSHLAERLVLAGVTAVGALISYTHLRDVWLHTGAPWDRLGPLLPDGLFASAWLQMRRRRRQGDAVGWLAWLALAVALLATLGGNIAAAIIAGHRDPLSLVVAGLPAAVFALAWELTTGHGSRRPERQEGGQEAASGSEPGIAPDQQESDQEEREVESPEPFEVKRDRLLREGASRKRLMEELSLDEWPARKLQEEWKRRQEGQEATG